MLDILAINQLINQSFSKEDLMTVSKKLLLTLQTINTMLSIRLQFKFLWKIN